MTRTSEDLKLLVNFLNKKVPIKTVTGRALESTILRDWYYEHGISYDTLRFGLTNLLAPVLNVPRNWRPALRKKQIAFMNRYAPKVGLGSLVKELNKHAKKPHWQMIATSKPSAKIIVSGFTGTIEKREFSNPVWQAVANLLESGEIFWIGQCPVCKDLFIKNRDWQKCCPKSACQKTYNNQLAADRQARVRRKRKAQKILSHV